MFGSGSAVFGGGAGGGGGGANTFGGVASGGGGANTFGGVASGGGGIFGGGAAPVAAPGGCITFKVLKILRKLLARLSWIDCHNSLYL